MKLITFERVPLQAGGMLSVQSFPLAGDGRSVQFTFDDGRYAGREIYLCIDDKLRRTPFQNGSPMQTPISGIEWVVPGPHTALAVVVDKGIVKLNNIQPQVPDITLRWGGYSVTAQFQAKLSAVIQCKDGYQLASCYQSQGLQDPEGTVRDALEENYGKIAARVIGEAEKDGSLTTQTVVNEMIRLNETIRKQAVEKTQREHPWLVVNSSWSTLAVTNSEFVLDAVNKDAEEKARRRAKLFDLILEMMGRPVLTPEVTQLIQCYVNNKPEFTEEDTVRLIVKLKPLLNSIPLELQEKIVREELRQPGFGMGGAHERLL